MPSEYMIKEINEWAADYKMEIPSKDHFAESLKALP